MNQIAFRLGPLALVLTIISICVTTMGILTYTTAEADWRLAQKYADTVGKNYNLEREGQQFLQQFSDALSTTQKGLPADVTIDEQGVIWKQFTQGNSSLSVGLVLREEHSYEIVSWKIEKQWELDQKQENLWMGE